MNDNKVIVDDRIPKIKEMKKQKANRRLAILVSVFFVIIVIVAYVQSPFSKLNTVTITGNYLLTEEMIYKQANLSDGMFYLNFTVNQVTYDLEELVEVQSVSVNREWPNHLHIDIQEEKVVAFWDDGQALYPVLPSGHIIKYYPWKDYGFNEPILSGWPNKDGLIELSHELSQLPASVVNLISDITLTPTIADPYRLTVHMVDGYEVITSIRHFSKNMRWYPQLVEDLEQSGDTEGVFKLLDSLRFEQRIIENEQVNDYEEQENEE